MNRNAPDFGAIARRFPLVSRSRPSCLALEARVAELLEIARESGGGDDHRRLTRAAEVCNKAALVASDCGLADLARSLCWRQYDVFDQARPLPAQVAKLALQPVLNIPRQLIREGDGDGAYQILEQLYRAARAQTVTEIAGRRISLREVTYTPEDHKTVCTLLWAALLADGARALALAGRWQEAADHAARHRGVGARMLDGRQVSILALVDRGHIDQAIAMVDNTMTPEPWEQAVASLLRVYCQRVSGTIIKKDATAMLSQAFKLVDQADPSTAVFRTRVGTTVLDLANGCDFDQLPGLRATIIAAAATDAYAGREILTHQLLRHTMTTDEKESLTALVQSSGLGCAAIPPELLDDLMHSFVLAEDRLRALLNA